MFRSELTSLPLPSLYDTDVLFFWLTKKKGDWIEAYLGPDTETDSEIEVTLQQGFIER